MKKNLRMLLFLLGFIIIASVTGSESVHAYLQLDSAQEIINVINQYRIENGLAGLQVNSSLMAAAQRHSDYMATSGLITHSEPDGSTGKTRAQAEGYGTGYIILISEIIYGGWDQSAQDAIEWWIASTNHNPWILHYQYLEIGAGAATNGTSNYYTALLATVTEWEDPNNPPTTTEETPESSETPSTEEPTEEPTPYPTAVPIVTATPNPDGSVIHIVQQGQYLSSIAIAYGVSLETLYDLNGLNQYSILYVGDQIIVVPTDNPEPTPTNTLLPETTEEITPTQTATAVTGFATPTPLADGSIVHILLSGQVLWDLSIMYDVPLSTLYELNGLYEWSYVYPGDQIIISPAYTPTPTATLVPPTPTSTLLPTYTPTLIPPTQTAVPEVVQEITEIADPQEEVEDNEQDEIIPIPTAVDDSPNEQQTNRETLLILLIILVGLLFMLISFVLIFRNR